MHLQLIAFLYIYLEQRMIYEAINKPAVAPEIHKCDIACCTVNRFVLSTSSKFEIRPFADDEILSHSGDGNSKVKPVVSSKGGNPHNL